MEISKQKIQNRFCAASPHYESVASIQKECAQILVTLLQTHCPDFYPSSVLDLGTGTGYLAEILSSHFPKSIYSLNDISPKMIENTKEKFRANPLFHFHLSDMETTDFPPHELVMSNLALQWAHAFEKMLKKAYDVSNVFAFTCLLDGTFVEWENLLHHYHLPSPLKNYPSRDDLTSTLNSFSSQDLFFETKNFHMTFQSARSFMGYLKNLGASYSSNNFPFPDLKKMIKTHHQEFEVTYKVFFGILKRV